MRALSAIVAVAGLAFLVACGGGGTPTGVPITITLTPSSGTVTAGQILNIVAAASDNKGVTWTLSGVGSLSNQTSTSVTYNAPATVTNTSTATVTATSVGSPGVSASLEITVQGIGVSLTPNAPQTVNQGQTLNIAAAVSNDPSNKGVSWTLSGIGTLSGQTTTSATYNAPSSVPNNSSVTVTAASIANPSSKAVLEITALPSGAGPNVAAISVNGGPVPGFSYLNGAFTSVTVCAPGSSDCQTIDGILVDSGSFGLRVLASQLTVSLPVLVDSSGNQLNNCVNFADGSFLWGTVAVADVAIGGEIASGTSIQTIETPTSYSIGSGCTGTNEDTQQTLGANGILGVGPEPFDCGFACDPNGNSSPPPVYYLCSSTLPCQAVFVSCGALCQDSAPNQQVTNPVFNFPVDNNGVVLELPAVAGAAPTADGLMVFGIGTQSNNGLGGATVFALDVNGNFTTNFNGSALTSSFIDSGSNGLFFPDSSLTICSGNNSSWYCPAATTPLSATNVSGGSSNTVNFNVDNFDTVTAANPNDAAFSSVAGPYSLGFDWGLPFFYGRTVFTGIDGVPPPVGVPAGPFWAY